MSKPIFWALVASIAIPLTTSCTSRVKEEVLAGISCDTAGITYNSKVKSILTTKCYGCHDPNAGNTPPDLSNFGTSFTSRSSIGQRISLPDSDPLHMPPLTSTPLSQCEKTAILTWIRQGGKEN